MSPSGTGTLTRRGALGLLSASVVAGCGSAVVPVRPAAADGVPAELERRFGVTLAVHADTADGRTVSHRADEPFAFCSMFKFWAAVALLRNRPPEYLRTRVPITPDQLMASSVVTRGRVATGMSLAEVCDAALRFSDGTAGNLLLRDAGGPAGLTAFLRGIGDPVSRVDRTEPFLADAVPGDPRDTTTARAFTTTLRAALVADLVPEPNRDLLRDLMRRNTTGVDRIRAGVPADWTVANRTGTGDHGTCNDAAVLWPASGAPPIALTVHSRGIGRDDARRPEALAAVARHVVGALA